MRLICWLFRHRLKRVDRSDCGDLEKLFCVRCRRFYAMYHPVHYFYEWDHEDEQMLRELKEPPCA